MDEQATRALNYQHFSASPVSSLRRLGCFGKPPAADHHFKRFWSVISFEDGSDVSNYAVETDTLEDAANEYRATDVYDLDQGKHYEVDWIQEPRLVK